MVIGIFHIIYTIHAWTTIRHGQQKPKKHAKNSTKNNIVNLEILNPPKAMDADIKSKKGKLLLK